MLTTEFGGILFKNKDFGLNNFVSHAFVILGFCVFNWLLFPNIDYF